MKLEFFLTDFKKNIQITKFHANCPVGAELFHVDRRTWRSQCHFFAILWMRLKMRKAG